MEISKVRLDIENFTNLMYQAKLSPQEFRTSLRVGEVRKSKVLFVSWGFINCFLSEFSFLETKKVRIHCLKGLVVYY